MKTFYAADLFCGGGGTSTGMINAFVKQGIEYELVGVNHWQIAIDTNKLNHEKARYYRDSVENISPRDLVPGGRLNFLWASPECTNHSRAKGGRPRDDQSRSTAWHVLKWIQELIIDRVYIENVEEFLAWGPVDDKGNIIKSKKGEIFKKFIGMIKAFGYRVEYRILNAADFGAPTCRKRLIIQAARGKEKICWPEPTHVKDPGLLEGLYKSWVPARDIIDWDIPGKSIFDRKKPLVPNTLRRIYSGIVKYWGAAANLYTPLVRQEIIRSCQCHRKCPLMYLYSLPKLKTQGIEAPFMLIMRGTAAKQDTPSCKAISDAVPAISTRNHVAIIEPFVSRYNGGDNRHSQIADPVPVQDCSNRYGVVQPVIVTLRGTNKSNINSSCRPSSDPCPTVTANGTHIGVVEPCVFATGHTSGGHRASGMNDPISTIVTKAEHCLVSPMVVDMTHTADSKGRIRSANDPVNTITTRNNIAIVEAMFIPQHGGGSVKPVSNPLPTIATEGAISQIEPFISTYYGNGTAESINEPLDTVTCKERFGLCAGRCFIDAKGSIFKLDILFRMFQPSELAAAMSFPKNYKFAGNKSNQVKQIGNAVPPVLAEALIKAAIVA
ncbi:MAG: hypothetical protein A2020_12280 [Lentisphaerae bacterium GWF2_45_14]|nr:MAG: hypothetical protein A2020_12280 [Lentisphaerae bacterium GWF2_45_14]